MTTKDKKDLLNKEMNDLISEQLAEARKQKFKNELEASLYTKKQGEELIEFIKRRKKELGIEDSTKQGAFLCYN